MYKIRCIATFGYRLKGRLTQTHQNCLSRAPINKKQKFRSEDFLINYCQLILYNRSHPSRLG